MPFLRRRFLAAVVATLGISDLTLATTPFVPVYPAQPAPGTIYWGAAIGGNADPGPRHETPTGVSMGVHRTYFKWAQRDTAYMKNIVADDQTKGRVPWISFKTPSWSEMASGADDAQIDKLLKNLKATEQPVWLSIWHEPENDPSQGTAADYVAMQKRVRDRMTALGIKNVALVGDFMAWTWDPNSKRDPDQWWGNGIYDLLGIDIYQNSEKSLLTNNWYDVRAWAKDKGVDIAVAEWGLRGSDAAAGNLVRQWYNAAIASDTDNRGARVVALSAFDSSLNSPDGSWELTGAQLDTFNALMLAPTSVHLPEPGSMGLTLLLAVPFFGRRRQRTFH